jgi:flavodoxin
MTNQRTVAIVYASIHHGNTRKLAESLASELLADLFAIDEIGRADLTQYEVVGLGSGIYFGRNHATLLNLVNAWQKPPRKVFIFSTAGLPFLKCFQHASLRRRLKTRGCEVVAEFCCRGWDTVGPLWFIGGINRKHPDSSDLRRATEFARQLKSSVSAS